MENKKRPHIPTQSMHLHSPEDGGLDFGIEFFEIKVDGIGAAEKSFSQNTNYTILWLKNGQGDFQVDFQEYNFEKETMIFLTPGQYFHIDNGTFHIVKYSFRRQFFCVEKNNSQNLCNGVLFNHVYAVASIFIGEKEKAVFAKYTQDIITAFSMFSNLNRAAIKGLLNRFLSTSVDVWIRQSPFTPDMTEEETNMLFAFRRALEINFHKKKSMAEYAQSIGTSEKKMQRLVKNRIGKKLSELRALRQLTEAKRLLYFTGKTSKEIGFDIGFDDPAYFTRFFKKNMGITPAQFREKHGVEHFDHIVEELKNLIDLHFKKEHSVSFYAQKLFLTPRTLTEITKKANGQTVSDLLKFRLLLEAKRMLYFTKKNIKEIAWELGYEEAAYFSHFFKSAIGMSPEYYRNKWKGKEINPNFDLAEEFGKHEWQLQN